MIEGYKKVIQFFPVEEQGESSKVATWEKYLDHDALREFIKENRNLDQISFTRGDIFSICERDVADGLFASVIWGYPRGMRGNNFMKFLANIDEIKRTVSFNKSLSHADLTHLLNVQGIGISTISKFLYFFRCSYNGHKCLILDEVMNGICKGEVFSEDFPLLKNSGNYRDKAITFYPTYLESMTNIAKKLDATEERVESFLFLVGRNFLPSH
jgi:hypothetical protein